MSWATLKNPKDASHQGLKKGLPLTIRFSIPFNVQVCRSFLLTIKSISRSFPSAYESVFSPFETPCLPSSKPCPSPYTPCGGYSHDHPQPRSLPLTRPLEGGYRNVSIQPASGPSLPPERRFLSHRNPSATHPHPILVVLLARPLFVRPSSTPWRLVVLC